MVTSKTSAPRQEGGLLQYFTGSNHQPMLRLYHSYGDADRLLVMGHALMSPPPQPELYAKGFWHNAPAMLRLFAVRPIPLAKVRITVGQEIQEIQAADDGFFAAEWAPGYALKKVWEDVHAELIEHPEVSADGKIYMPQTAPFGVISDIDDTFLITHTHNVFHRLGTILSNNPRSRQPFTGVVDHYNALALGGTTPDKPNPFFYVSSSEWNLYDYLKEFCRWHKMPEGVFLLNQLKGLTSFWNTGGNNHDGKFTRIARILEEFPSERYVLMGDDTQRDPHIFSRIVRDFPGRIIAVYIRHRVKEHLERTRKYEVEMQTAGVEVCYFTHSKTALQHSRDIGIANKG
jgi:phosphatidate phosphatase APP1